MPIFPARGLLHTCHTTLADAYFTNQEDCSVLASDNQKLNFANMLQHLATFGSRFSEVQDRLIGFAHHVMACGLLHTCHTAVADTYFTRQKACRIFVFAKAQRSSCEASFSCFSHVLRNMGMRIGDWLTAKALPDIKPSYKLCCQKKFMLQAQPASKGLTRIKSMAIELCSQKSLMGQAQPTSKGLAPIETVAIRQ